jgi:hypothetical protein
MGRDSASAALLNVNALAAAQTDPHVNGAGRTARASKSPFVTSAQQVPPF